jgi:hypothetical protein
MSGGEIFFWIVIGVLAALCAWGMFRSRKPHYQPHEESASPQVAPENQPMYMHLSEIALWPEHPAFEDSIAELPAPATAKVTEMPKRKSAPKKAAKKAPKRPAKK